MESNNGFKKGFDKVKNGDARTVRQDIKDALGIKSSSTWYNRLYGTVIPNKVEVEAIEKIFLEHGITDVWG